MTKMSLKIPSKREEIVKYVKDNNPDMIDKIDFIVRMYIRLEKDMEHRKRLGPRYKKTEKKKE